jgi:signal transduction histidine kinase
MSKRELTLRSALLGVILAAVVTASSLVLPLDFIESSLFDLRHRLSFNPSPDPRIALITIDDVTSAELNEVTPLSLETHAELIEKLEAANPKGVGYIVDLNQAIPKQSEESHKTLERFLQAGVRMNLQGNPLVLGLPFDLNGEVLPPQELQSLPSAIAIIHRDGKIFGKDRVTRRALVSLFGRSTLETSLASRAYTQQDFSKPPGLYREKESDAEFFLFRTHKAEGLIYDAEHARFPYPTYSALDLLHGKVGKQELEGRLVLVGSFQKENPNDHTTIPHGLEPLLVPKLLVHAFILDSILNHNGITAIPQPVVALLVFLTSILLVQASFRSRPSRLMWITFGVLSAWLVISWLLFQPLGSFLSLWLPIANPISAIVVSFYLMLPFRLYFEHRKSGQLEEKNRMLIEVEELKTNFLQLVTHDLKTPIAKIQGLAEQLNRELQGKLNTDERSVLGAIMGASDELNHFVSSLLEVSRLDTQGLNLQLQSRDLETLLENVVRKLAFSAHNKGITIETNFEPLFPFRMDANLIQKVLTNLIDNAIKYSPQDTVVHILAKEDADSAVIEISDQGIGIPDEDKKQLFQRFHRIKNDTTRRIKGTGLGLYLSKYFIEAHNGTIAVSDSVGGGTTITIRLPLNLKEDQLFPGLTTKTNKPKEKNRYA